MLKKKYCLQSELLTGVQVGVLVPQMVLKRMEEVEELLEEVKCP